MQRSAPIGNNDESSSGRKSATPTPRGDNPSPSKPEAVVHAMKVWHKVPTCRTYFA